MSSLRLLPSVRFDGLQPAGIRILAACDQASRFFKLDLTVSCGTDSHGPDDPHTKGRAIDLRTKDLSEADIFAVYDFLVGVLGIDFTVLFEVPQLPDGPLAKIAYVNPKATGPHFHVQLSKHYAGSWPDGRLA